MEEEKQESGSTEEPISEIDDTSSIEEKIDDKIEEVEEAKEKAQEDKIGSTQIESEGIMKEEE